MTQRDDMDMQGHQRTERVPRIMIAAARSGSGKTTVTCGLLAALKEYGRRPCSFKCGPDYIDPMFHRRVLGIPSGNLDAYFADGETLRYLMASEYEEAGADLAVIEGVMGYYDGLGGTTSVGSAYHLARETGTPVILVMDAKGASVTIAAEIKGILHYGETAATKVRAFEKTGSADTEEFSGIAGILLNRASKGFYPRLKSLIEEQCGIPVVGYLPEMKDTLSSRHLGLVQPEELPEMEKWIREIRQQVFETVDLDQICRIADAASPIEYDEDVIKKHAGCCTGVEHVPAAKADVEYAPAAKAEVEHTSAAYIDDEHASIAYTGRSCGTAVYAERKEETIKCTNGSGRTVGDDDREETTVLYGDTETAGKVRIAYACDEAFTFSYKENEHLLRDMGAELVYFSPIHDRKLPEGIDGLILPGGYPELHVRELEANESMRQSVREAVTGGLPTIAECGGFLYLCEHLTDSDGVTGEMCGVIPTDGNPAGSLRRFGYFEAETVRDGLFGPAGTRMRGHEFHHWDTEFKGDGMIMRKAMSERTEKAVIYTDTLAAGFPHFYYAGYPQAAAAYLHACRRYRKKRM